jgi:hypothetical protein
VKERTPKELLRWLTGRPVEPRVTDEEVFEELFAEGIDVDALIAAATLVLRRVRDKERVMGVPVEQILDGQRYR